MTFFQTDSGAQSGHQASGTGCEADPHAVNVGNAERWLSALAGGAIAAAGFRSRSRLGLLAIIGGGALVYRGLKGHCMTYAALGLSTADHDPATPHAYFEHGVHVEEVMTINRTPWELYAFWRDFSNLPRFMRHVKSVDVIDAKRSRWSVEDPAGRTIEWDAEIINDEPNALIAWRSLGDAGVDNAGSVRFVPGDEGHGTEVRVVIDYIPPAGVVGQWVAALFGKNLAGEIREDLRRFKRVMEVDTQVEEREPRSRG